MNTKLLSGAGCLLLMLAAMTPGAVGHDERQEFIPSDNGVSGTYYGGAGPAIADEANYPDTIAAGAILCDVEVAGDGTTPFPQDEVHVDGAAGGAVQDTNDDGGLGGACHVRTYLHAPYNTPGCPSGQAHAINEGFLGPFIGASCDWKTIVGGTPASDIFLLCVVNSLIQGQPLNVVDCLTTFITCLGDPTGCTGGGIESCGSDGSSDGINYGNGAFGVDYPTAGAHQGDAFPDLDVNRDGTVDGACAASDATQQVFVFDAVATNHNTNPNVPSNGGLPWIHPALTGQIWTDAIGPCPAGVIPITGALLPAGAPPGPLPGLPGGTTFICTAPCTSAAYSTYANKFTGPAGGAVTTKVIDCAQGAAADAQNNPQTPMGVKTGKWPAVATGAYACIIHADAGVVGEGQCIPEAVFP